MLMVSVVEIEIDVVVGINRFPCNISFAGEAGTAGCDRC